MSENQIKIRVITAYLEEQSDAESARYAFSYTIAITNCGEEGVSLLSRYWLIIDANDERQEVHGEGVVGEQPHIEPGETYQYTSGTLLKTPLGIMQGSYQMVSDSGAYFDAPIDPFRLADPKSLH
ncbi:MAG: Co2+/Mg2+ efflux protein ApaG [Pseudomonadales bacterium]